MVRRSILDQIFKEMMKVRQRLDNIESNFSNWNPQPVQIPESSLIALPDHLRKTYVVVANKGECDAAQVSNRTGRTRAIESNYLNQLLRMGWLSKRRISKAVHFRPVSKTAIEKQYSFPTQINYKPTKTRP
jgi:ArsR family transcriptional regulator, lead/cadmium/zinc/bismuth-responsive transcriptional repressor